MMEWLNEDLRALADLAEAVRRDPALVQALENACKHVLDCLLGGGKLLSFGNGGSATDAMHLAEELVGRYRANRRPLPAVCLNADGSALTCIANDFGYDEVFARPVAALSRPGDVVVAISTSGKSPSILRGLEAARAAGASTVGLLGHDGGPAKALCDVSFVVPHASNARIQELHTFALHAMCEAVERAIVEAS
jgi:D-sedoheptulose 7-phosphate isomerase